jgi:hypothetical protein
MRYYVVTAVRVDQLGQITHVVMDREDPGETGRWRLWSPSATEYSAAEVARLIEDGNIVVTVFLKDSGRVFGAPLRRFLYDDSHEGIELSDEPEGFTYRDLIQLGD